MSLTVHDIATGDYKELREWVKQFKKRWMAEQYIRDHNEGKWRNRMMPQQKAALAWRFGDATYSVDRRGQLHKRNAMTGVFVKFGVNEDHKDLRKEALKDQADAREARQRQRLHMEQQRREAKERAKSA